MRLMSEDAAEVVSTQANAFSFVLSGLGRLAAGCETLDAGVREQVRPHGSAHGEDLLQDFILYLRRPLEEDMALAEVARRFHLEPVEVLAVRLAIAAEQDLLVGHLLSHLQPPLALSRPTIGLVAQAYAPAQVHQAVQALGQGNAVRCGLLQMCGEDGPLPERQMRIPLPTALALGDVESPWPGTAPLVQEVRAIALGASAEARAAALAHRLLAPATLSPTLVIRSGDTHEARSAADQVCSRMALRGTMVQTDQVAGMAPWLTLNGLIPVFSLWLLPGERRPAPTIPGYDGAVILLMGPEGECDAEGRIVLDWRLETPPAQERAELWRAALGEAAEDEAMAEQLAHEHRHAAGRIATLAAMAREEAAARMGSEAGLRVTRADVRAVARRGEAVRLGALAELIADEVEDAALVVPLVLRRELESLVVRCRLREHFPEALGISIQARYRPSVRALFVGPSGTGKTLAVAWIATRLGIPLFRVDLSAISSKYIGETEKNLSQLLARAEQSEVVLLFDEADSLFGKRTDIQDSNDRFANAQTNYLLQRMETYNGITILTSNGRSRFDDAFSRRFDMIVPFPMPGPQERRDLWIAHLGCDAGGGLTPAQWNVLAAGADLTGGQIRNAVLCGAVAAAQEGGRIAYRHLLTGVASEYRKLSRQMPNELKQAEAAGRIDTRMD
jgi:hypothetical protein